MSWTVRCWSYGTKRMQQRELHRVMRKARDRHMDCSIVGFGRMDGQQFCVGLMAPEDTVERLVSVLRPNGRSFDATDAERSAMLARREMIVRTHPKNQHVHIDHGEDHFLYPDGSVGRW